MPNPDPKQEHLRPGWNKGLEKARGVPKLRPGEVSRTVRVRGPEALFKELEALTPVQVGEILKRHLSGPRSSWGVGEQLEGGGGDAP